VNSKSVKQVSNFCTLLPIFLSKIINISRFNFSSADDRLKLLGVNGIGIKDQINRSIYSFLAKIYSYPFEH
jgi:hypothetical protein